VGVNRLQRNSAARSEVQTVPIITAARDVSRGVLLTKDDLTTQQWPKSMAPPAAAEKLDDCVGRAVLVPLVKGEPVLGSKLADKNAGRGLAAMIPHGMRAFTIRTPHVAAGVGGFILPGNRVDILLTTTGTGAGDPTGGGATTTLLQNVEVLAVAQLLDAPEENKVDPKEVSSVTLLVTPDQAAKLDLGMNKGLLHLALRNPNDDEDSNARPATMAQLRLHQDSPQPSSASVVMQTAPIGVEENTPVAGTLPSVSSDSPAKSRARSGMIHTIRGTKRDTLVVEW
jgi:pilus assembly protein CpaB